MTHFQGGDGEDTQLPGQPVGHSYRRFEVLGTGAMGTVYRGEDRRGNHLAVKLLRAELAADPVVLARFIQERALLLKLASPNIVRVVDLVVEGDTVAIVMEKVDGGSLSQYLKRRGHRAGTEEAIHICIDVLEGLSVAHAQGVVHRDIKPDNVLIDDSSSELRAKVTDFGIAGLIEGSAHTRLTSLVGTPEYMAPELVESLQATSAVDVYSAGIVLYELVAGKTPFGGGSVLAILKRHAEQNPQRPDGVGDDLWSMLTVMLAKDPETRPTALQAEQGLKALLETGKSTLLRPPPDLELNAPLKPPLQSPSGIGSPLIEAVPNWATRDAPTPDVDVDVASPEPLVERVEIDAVEIEAVEIDPTSDVDESTILRSAGPPSLTPPDDPLGSVGGVPIPVEDAPQSVPIESDSLLVDAEGGWATTEAPSDDAAIVPPPLVEEHAEIDLTDEVDDSTIRRGSVPLAAVPLGTPFETSSGAAVPVEEPAGLDPVGLHSTPADAEPDAANAELRAEEQRRAEEAAAAELRAEEQRRAEEAAAVGIAAVAEHAQSDPAAVDSARVESASGVAHAESELPDDEDEWTIVRQSSSPTSPPATSPSAPARKGRRLLVGVGGSLLLVVAIALGAILLTGSNNKPAAAATLDGVAISEAQLNSDLAAIASSAGYRCYLDAQAYELTNGESQLFAEPKSAFDAYYLQTEIGHQVVFALAATKHIAVTPDQLTEARASLSSQITGVMGSAASSPAPLQNACGSQTSDSASTVLASLPPSFVANEVRFVATHDDLELVESGVGDSPRDLETYFDQHRSMFDMDCYLAASFPTLAAAQTVADTNPGASFPQVAFGSGGGKQTCVTASMLASALPASANFAGLGVDQVSAPFADNGRYLLLQITSQKPSSFNAVNAQVIQAVETNGSQPTQSALSALERKASVWVNPRYGTWQSQDDAVVPPKT